MHYGCMKNHRHQLAASTLALATLLAASPALADGVPAGSIIENIATATYDDGGVTPRTVVSNPVEVQVDELLNVTTTWQDGSAVPIGNASAVLTYEVTNTGNGPEAFNLAADPGRTGNDFDVTIDGIAYDTNGNGVYDEGVDVVLGAGEASPVLDADEALTVFVLVSSPGGVTDGQTSDVNLLAEAVTGTGPPGTTFAGQGEGGSDAVVGLTNADADQVQDASQSMVASFSEERAELKAIAQQLSETSELEKQRELFAAFTEKAGPMFEDALSGGTIHKKFCPMAFDNKGAYWYADIEEINNPYFGDKMPNCGSVKKTIKK